MAKHPVQVIRPLCHVRRLVTSQSECIDEEPDPLQVSADQRAHAAPFCHRPASTDAPSILRNVTVLTYLLSAINKRHHAVQTNILDWLVVSALAKCFLVNFLPVRRFAGFYEIRNGDIIWFNLSTSQIGTVRMSQWLQAGSQENETHNNETKHKLLNANSTTCSRCFSRYWKVVERGWSWWTYCWDTKARKCKTQCWFCKRVNK